MTSITPKELSSRYGGSPTPSTLSNWRGAGLGPPHFRDRGRIKYRMEDVVAWEREMEAEKPKVNGVG